MKEEIHLMSKLQSLSLALVLLMLAQTTEASDCFGWSITKRASYMELLPQLLFYD